MDPRAFIHPAKITSSSSTFKAERRLPWSWVFGQKAKNWPSRHSRNREALLTTAAPFPAGKVEHMEVDFDPLHIMGRRCQACPCPCPCELQIAVLRHAIHFVYGSTPLVLLSSSPLNTGCCTKAHCRSWPALAALTTLHCILHLLF